MNPLLQRAVLAAMATPAVAMLAGCGADAPTDAVPTVSPTSHGPLKDGSYSAVGDYVNPGGISKLKVEVVLKGGLVTSLTVSPEAENAVSRQFQQKFVSGIAPLVVGKPIDGLKVDKVAGSSLTQKGFEEAVGRIIADASA
jgi:uncharacterized protein with FMN-binding domain